MLEKKEPLRGDDTSMGYNGYIPPAAFNALEWEAAGIVHGIATLELHIRDGRLVRYVASRQNSFVLEELNSRGGRS